MNATDKLRDAFARALYLDSAGISEELAYNSIPEWDSVAHMALVAELERSFDVMLDTDEIIDMSSFGKARQILARHGVEF